MQKRLRAMTYAEALEAKKLAEKADEPIIEKEEPQKIDQSVTTLNGVSVFDLPSGGDIYPENMELYYTPLSFGEMKFLSGSTLSDLETIEFFMKKVQANFPIEELTYYDFYYITVLIKMATFGEVNYTMKFQCESCGTINEIPFSTEDLEFEEVRVPLPVKVELRNPFTTKDGEELKHIHFRPISIGRFKEMIENGDIGDDDVYMSQCIVECDAEDRLKLIKEVLVGVDTQILESIDIYMFHGVKDLTMKCKHIEKPEDMTEKEFKIALNKGESVGEVCGRLHDIPFQHISEYISSTDECKDIIGKRVDFGV